MCRRGEGSVLPIPPITKKFREEMSNRLVTKIKKTDNIKFAKYRSLYSKSQISHKQLSKVLSWGAEIVGSKDSTKSTDQTFNPQQCSISLVALIGWLMAGKMEYCEFYFHSVIWSFPKVYYYEVWRGTFISFLSVLFDQSLDYYEWTFPWVH